MAKIHPKGIVPHALGPTYTENSTIKFQNGGGHKMKPAKPDEQGMGNSSGTIPNKTLIPTMKGNMTPKESKVMKTGTWFKPGAYAGDMLPNASEGYMVDRDSVLKTSYEKSGRK